MKILGAAYDFVSVAPKYSYSQGEGWVKAKIRSGSSCDWGEFKNYVWVGKPNSSGEYLIGGYGSYPSPLPCIYTYGIYYGFTLSGVIEGTSSTADYVWSGSYASLNKIAWYAAKFIPNYPGPPYYGGGYVQVTGSNVCGTSIPVVSGYGPCGGGFIAVPNPGDDYVDITTDPDKFDPARLSLDLECTLTVYDNIGVSKRTISSKIFHIG